jgi:hypothetical protein
MIEKVIPERSNAMTAPAKRYKTNYKKKVDVESDTYLPLDVIHLEFAPGR